MKDIYKDNLIKVTKKVSKGNNNEKCAVCRSLCACELSIFYDENRDAESLVDKKRVCEKCDLSWTDEYTEGLNLGHLSISLQHYKDILYGVELRNIYFQADYSCKHVKDSKLLKKNLENVVSDYEASLKQKKYVKEFKTEDDAVEYLKSQEYWFSDVNPLDSDPTTKYILNLPYNRVSTTEQESAAIHQLSKKPEITNIQKRWFRILRDDI